MAESRISRFLARLSTAVISTPTGVSMISSIEEWISGGDQYDKWPQGITGVWDAYTKISIVRQSINTLAHFATRNSFSVDAVAISGEGKTEDVKTIVTTIDEINRLTNAELTWFVAMIKREIWGRCAFEIVRDGNGNIVMLLPLLSSVLVPVIDPDTLTISHFRYGWGGEQQELDPWDIIYFAKDALEWNQLGISAVDTVKRQINTKVNIERDLREAAKRQWAPIGLFEMDTKNIPTAAAKQAEMTKFSNELKPGRSLVYSRKIVPTIIDLKADIVALVRALDKADEEIMGNWNIPKALLSREKTLTKATLEYSLKALYEGPVAGLQRYFKREIERQFYQRILFDLNLDDNYRARHIWRPTVVHDPQLIRSLAYAVDRGAMSKREMFDVLGWEMMDEPPASQPTDEQVLARAMEDKIDARIAQILGDQEVESEELANIVQSLGGENQ